MNIQARRNFIKTLGGATIGASILPLSGTFAKNIEREARKWQNLTPNEMASNEDFWFEIQKAYVQSAHFINLENGYMSPAAEEVLNAQIKNIRQINEAPAFYMRRSKYDDMLEIKRKLAAFAGCSPEELLITRNTTESLNTIILGLDLQKGDEALMTNQDYGSMLIQFAYRARREGIVNNVISLPLLPKNKMEVVNVFEKAITPNTKVLLLTHMINLTGQLLPAKEISEMAHERGIQVIIDAAHSFAHVEHKIPDLGGDYYAASMHKWLGTPLGLGLLYIKKDRIQNVWPLFGETNFPDHDIRKFERIGTIPNSSHLAIANAIRFHEAIGSARKEARLRYLKNYWVDKVKDNPKIIINTPMGDDQSCAIANVRIDGMTPAELTKKLYDDYRIFTVAIDMDAVQGVRVTPHLYTRIEDVEKFAFALNDIVKKNAGG